MGREVVTDSLLELRHFDGKVVGRMSHEDQLKLRWARDAEIARFFRLCDALSPRELEQAYAQLLDLHEKDAKREGPHQNGLMLSAYRCARELGKRKLTGIKRAFGSLLSSPSTKLQLVVEFRSSDALRGVSEEDLLSLLAQHGAAD